MNKNKNPPPSGNPTSTPAKFSPIDRAIDAMQPILQSTQIAFQQQTIYGPLPAPDLLAKYEEIQPGLVNRIVKMAEDESEHRRWMEKESIAIQSRE
jgi:uncharacterized membrane protein